MFRTVPLSIIRSFSLYTQQWYMSHSLRAGSGRIFILTMLYGVLSKWKSSIKLQIASKKFPSTITLHLHSVYCQCSTYTTKGAPRQRRPAIWVKWIWNSIATCTNSKWPHNTQDSQHNQKFCFTCLYHSYTILHVIFTFYILYSAILYQSIKVNELSNFQALPTVY